MRAPNPQTDQECRSLLQKVVRRGHTTLVRAVVSYLQTQGDAPWLKRRAGVIIFEECWPAAAHNPISGNLDATLDTLVQIARSAKFKDAAGLGSLAFALHEGDQSVLDEIHSNTALTHIAAMLDRPDDFWRETLDRCSQDAQRTLVTAARTTYRRGGWPWDRAFAMAAAFLATERLVPTVRGPVGKREPVFPYWVAIDRHTSHGKTALRETARRLNVPLDRLSWTSFYLESARTNKTIHSGWWNRERTWRLQKVGLGDKEAFELWDQASPILQDLLEDRANALQARVEAFTEGMPAAGTSSLRRIGSDLQQPSLLDPSD